MDLFSFKQLPLNIKQNFGFLYQIIDGERLISGGIGVLVFSSEKCLDFHDPTFQYYLIFLNYNKALIKYEMIL